MFAYIYRVFDNEIVFCRQKIFNHHIYCRGYARRNIRTFTQETESFFFN